METIIFLTVSPESHRTAEENLGIEYLASNLKKTLKYEVKIINGWIEKLSNEKIIERIKVYEMNETCSKICSRIKKYSCQQFERGARLKFFLNKQNSSNLYGRVCYESCTVQRQRSAVLGKLE